jgi:hypothetical protein
VHERALRFSRRSTLPRSHGHLQSPTNNQEPGHGNAATFSNTPHAYVEPGWTGRTWQTQTEQAATGGRKAAAAVLLAGRQSHCKYKLRQSAHLLISLERRVCHIYIYDKALIAYV